MGDTIEEQKQELDALESIYPEEFTLLSDDPPFKLKVFLKSQEVNCGPEDDPAEFETSFFLEADLPLEYPGIKPEIIFKECENLDDYEMELLNQSMEEQIEMNLGMSMIFAICAALQETLNSISEEKLKSKEAEAERRKKEIEELELKKLLGTPVTVQSFLEWKEKFDEERLKAKKLSAEEIAAKELAKTKLTGKQLFLRDKALGDVDIETGVESIEINETLFQDDEDLDFDDISEDEDVE